MQDARLVQLARQPEERERVKSLGVFDIGSNTILITVGRLSTSGKLEVLWDEGDVVRLSEGLVDGGPLQAAAKARALETLARFKSQAESLGVSDLQAAGTAAFRRAQDGSIFAKEIQEYLKIPVRILTGEEEARYSYQSAAMDFGQDGKTLGMIDIGGGSTEFVFGGSGPNYSLPMGTVRLTEKYRPTHPISDEQWRKIRSDIRELLATEIPKLPTLPETWAAVAATPASLAAVLLELPQYQPERIHGYRLKLEVLESLIERLRSLNLEARKTLPGMHPKRAELLPIGGAILAEAMSFLKMKEILVSDHGLRYGILWEEIQKIKG